MDLPYSLGTLVTLSLAVFRALCLYGNFSVFFPSSEFGYSKSVTVTSAAYALFLRRPSFR